MMKRIIWGLMMWVGLTAQAQQRILAGCYFYKELAVFAADGSKEWAMTLDPKGKTRFIHLQGVEKYNRTWVPSVKDYTGVVK